MHIASDTLSLHRTAVLASVDAVNAVIGDDLTRPTPCAGWDLATLLAHMTVQHRGFAAAARGGTDLDVWDPATVADAVAIRPRRYLFGGRGRCAQCVRGRRRARRDLRAARIRARRNISRSDGHRFSLRRLCGARLGRRSQHRRIIRAADATSSRPCCRSHSPFPMANSAPRRAARSVVPSRSMARWATWTGYLPISAVHRHGRH